MSADARGAVATEDEQAGRMKIRLTEFQKQRLPMPLCDNPYPSTKITFASFENHASKCFMSFTIHST
jgi:hypothetical protein